MGIHLRYFVKRVQKKKGWMKSTKVCNVDGGCVMQVTTQQKNPDGSYAVAEALTYVPGVHIDTESEPRKMVPIPAEKYEVNLLVEQGKRNLQSSWIKGAEEK
ncbi:hypothetical protein bthur0004_55560 [Bacillus thuringiensis serovar sotto str. T04001]|nr:hypothetical protein bthur0004_55560 [Bacillus thuringiensis serovar sotto str. T04001]